MRQSNLTLALVVRFVKQIQVTLFTLMKIKTEATTRST